MVIIITIGNKINVFIAIGSIGISICFGKNCGYMNIGGV